MSDMPTSAQYKLGVKIGRLAHEARQDGMSWDDLISTLRHSLQNATDARDLALFDNDGVLS